MCFSYYFLWLNGKTMLSSALYLIFVIQRHVILSSMLSTTMVNWSLDGVGNGEGCSGKRDALFPHL